jgi:hypothetical protein
MSLYSIGILGSGLVGAPLAGILADRAGVTPTFLVIAAVCAATALAMAGATVHLAGRGRQDDEARQPSAGSV